jgi:hypothetical protein
LAINICKFYATMNGFPSPTLLTCLVYTGWLLGAICIFFTYKIIGKTAEYRERMGKLHKFPEEAPRKSVETRHCKPAKSVAEVINYPKITNCTWKASLTRTQRSCIQKLMSI